jgi:ABC-type sugar transport system ATPase subunit
MADVIAVMDHGVLQQVGAPEALYRAPANRFVAGFIGGTPMNFIDAVFDDARALRVVGSDGPALAVPGLQGAPGDTVVLGIRPEDIELGPVAGDGAALCLGAEVLDHECHGEHDVLRLASAAGVLHAEVEAPCAAAPGDRVVCTLPLAHLHVFDPAGGQALCHGGRPC